MRAFADTTACMSGCSPGGPESAHPFHPREERRSTTSCRSSALRIAFPPDRVHPGQLRDEPRAGVARGALLDPQPGERIADLFCGLGNFSLPIASRGAQVIGFEGSAVLVERARANAAANGLVAQFEVADLFKAGIAPFGPFEKILIDPPREGAVELVKSLPDGLAAAHRLRVLRSGDARARCRRAGAHEGLPPRRRGRGQHVSAHRARRKHRAVRALSSSASSCCSAPACARRRRVRRDATGDFPSIVLPVKDPRSRSSRRDPLPADPKAPVEAPLSCAHRWRGQARHPPRSLVWNARRASSTRPGFTPAA